MASIGIRTNITSQPAATAEFRMSQAILMTSARDRYGSIS